MDWNDGRFVVLLTRDGAFFGSWQGLECHKSGAVVVTSGAVLTVIGG